nr:terpene synthase [Ficus microcarpa]
MSVPELASQTQTQTQSQVKRPLVDFPPSIWGDQFLIYHFVEKEYARKQEETEKLKEDVRRELLESADDSINQLNLIDEIQRLCVANHFKDEIKMALQRLYATYHSGHDDRDDDLYIVALRFRLLRQADYYISAVERFNKFIDEKGNFKECVTEDVRGMLSLYDAAQLRIHGEDILDKALAFTAAELSKSLETGTITSIPLAAQVRHALKQQMRKNLPRLEAKHYMKYVYPEMASHNKALLKLARLEFNLQQSMHRKELSVLTRYWKDLGLAAKSSFARDRLVECYLCGAGLCPEPENSLSRSLICKFNAIITVIDDVFDAFGLIDELKIFAEAVERWDMDCIKELPEYMQPSYEALLGLGAEIEMEMAKQGRTYRVPYAIEAMRFVTRGYVKEAQWLNQKYIPTVEEHREVSVLVTSTVAANLVVACAGMGDMATKETFDWIFTIPKIVQASGSVTRYMDDIVGHKFEHQREHPPSSVESYMKQYGASEEEAYKELSELVVNAWNDMNEECLKKTMPKQILDVAINFARTVDVLYSVEDSFTHVKKPQMDAVTSMLIDPVPEN